MHRSAFHRICGVSGVGALTLCVAASASAASASHRAVNVARHVARDAAAHSVRGGHSFAAVTDEGLPVAIQISHNGREITRMAAAVPLKCTSGAMMVLPAAYGDVPVAGNGSFRGSLEDSESEVNVTGTVTGKFNRSMTTVTTTWQLSVTVHTPTVSDSCSSGPVNVTATR
jgi:hypothetical protein